MLRGILFRITFLLRKQFNVIHYYSDFRESQWQPLDWQIIQQEKQLRELINFAYKNVPYYKKVFDSVKIKPSDISSIKDLEKLPLLTKKIIRENWSGLIPKNIDKIKYMHGSTGGSTGETLKYRKSLKDAARGLALLYRGWGYGGYKLGDKVAIIAGSSLIPSAEPVPNTKERIKEFFTPPLPLRRYSSYEMSEDNLFRYFHDINKWKPDIIRGYASSIYLFAKFIKNNNLELNFRPKAIFTTAEVLFDRQRKMIEQVFGVKVFDTYGVNDGGISAYECDAHNGFHVDTERGILEVVNEKNKQITDKQGRILATSLFHYAMPFIRYVTGDLGIISSSQCSCGRKSSLLKELSGRITDFLKLNGVIIGSPVLTVLMGKVDAEQYQIIQESPGSVTIKIVPGVNYNKKRDEDFIKESFVSHVGKVGIKFEYLSAIPAQGDRKYKFIINKVKGVREV